MIITAGKLKGRKLKTPKTNVRPTSSKVRESIFNMINVEGMKALDLFAGSGVMGLEALSRGAKEVVYVERNPDVIKILKQNLEITGESVKLIPGDALKVLDRFDKNEFDFIFIDPPYDSGLYEPVLSKIKNNQILNEGGFIVVEHKCGARIEADFEVYKTKKYGDTCITILQ
jgi:16S rRNA (guanine966-N2)-methyltransferase